MGPNDARAVDSLGAMTDPVIAQREAWKARETLAEQLIPFLVTRQIYTGAAQRDGHPAARRRRGVSVREGGRGRAQ